MSCRITIQKQNQDILTQVDTKSGFLTIIAVIEMNRLDMMANNLKPKALAEEEIQARKELLLNETLYREQINQKSLGMV
ncbi:unnamed protein product [Paramecium octaurelia]|uniref:Uncharacterized protein n=1 Tax=Paramecium octaurelia TaxID=43137 RepID=A0A8S1TIZ9_PAROT|nr:unnamed protein product [Paramecium octaurelia]